MLGQTGLVWCLETAAMCSALSAFGIQPDVMVAALLVVTLNLSFAVPLTPGNIGTHQLISVLILSLFGIERAAALSFSIGYQGAVHLMIVVIGGAFFCREGLSLSVLRREADRRPPMPTFRIEFNRERALLPQHDQWTPTPPGFFDGQYPAPFRIEANRISFERLLQIPVLGRFRPTAPPTAYRAVTTIRRRATGFKAFAPPLLQLSRIFPPSFIIGDAKWTMRSYYRRDIKRVMQPVWDSSPIVGEAFRDIDPDCKWFAKPATTVWIAQDESCL